MTDLATAARALLLAWDAAGLVEQMNASSEVAEAVDGIRKALPMETERPKTEIWFDGCWRWQVTWAPDRCAWGTSETVEVARKAAAEAIERDKLPGTPPGSA